MGLSLAPRGGGVVVIPTAPVLTKTSAAGVNPMSWSGAYTDIAVGDTLRLAWTVNGTAGAGDTHAVTSDDLLLASEGAYSFAWPAFVTASASFVGGDVITVTERIERSGTPSAYFTPALTDTISAFFANVFTYDGDSIAAGIFDPYFVAYPALTKHGRSVGGSALSDLVTRRGAVLTDDPEIFGVMIGANDLNAYTGGAAQYYTDLLSYLAPIKAGGAKIVVCTSTPQGTGTTNFATHNSRRVTLNASLRAGIGGGTIDAVADFDSTIMGLDATANNATYYDGVGLHPTTTGYNIIYPQLKGAANALRGVANSVTAFLFTDASNQALSTFVGSDTITISGLNYGETKAYSVSTGHSVRKRTGISGSFGAWVVNGSGTVVNGDGLEVGATTSGSNSTATNVVLTVGSVTDTFTATTLAVSGPAMKMSTTDKASSLTISADQYTVSQATDPQAVRLVRSTIAFTGKRYCEMLINSKSGVFDPMMGVCNATAATSGANQSSVPGNGNSDGGGTGPSGEIWPGSIYSTGAPSAGDRIMLAVDEPNKLIWLGKNGTWAPTTNPNTNTNGTNVGALAAFYLWIALDRIDNVTIKLASGDWSYSPPTGFTAMP